MRKRVIVLALATIMDGQAGTIEPGFARQILSPANVPRVRRIEILEIRFGGAKTGRWCSGSIDIDEMLENLRELGADVSMVNQPEPGATPKTSPRRP